MTLSRLLPLLLLVPALTMADEDRNFKLTPGNFRVGGLLEHAANKAIVLDSTVAISQEPVFPLQSNQLYLRIKKSVKEYQWFSGQAKPEEYMKLHAFNLKDNHLGPREVLGLRLYASRQYKAFQDEAEIYFDADYIYSPRVTKLLFMKNGKWQVLNECAHPGMIHIKSDEKKLDIVSFNAPLKDSRDIYPVKPGYYMFGFSAPGKYPYVDIKELKRGEQLTFDVQFPVLDSVSKLQFGMSVTLDQVKAAKTLEEAEALYDTYSAEVDRNVQQLNMAEFDNAYPPIKLADSLGIDDSSSDYRKYVSQYRYYRSESEKIWRGKKLSDVNLVFDALHAKLDSLQALPVQMNIRPVSSEKFMSATDSTKIDYLKFVFGAERSRVDVTWVGTFEGISMDSLLAMLNDNKSPIVSTLFIANNKPVWVYREGKLVGRYNYRYDKLGFRMGDSLYVGKGSFILPAYVAHEPEVEEWLASMKGATATAAVDTSKVMADTAKSEENKKIIEHATRGTVAVVDSGSFRYRGKVVSMSPFAIHTTEVTQEFFEKVMATLDSTKRIPNKSAFKGAKKPVQNVTWDNAQYFCKVLGGDLPTEAQWEYAGRAGSNEGALWTSDDAISVNKYAIFASNSLKLGQKDSAYGPHEVATKLPNAWGLYDMSGNVAEWTLDNYFTITFSIEDSNPTGSYWGTSKVLKGGSWKDKPKNLNMTVRDDEDPRYWADNIGFRCAFPLHRIIQE